MIASAVVIPVVLFVGAAWQSRADALREGEDEIIRSISELRDSVQVILDGEKRTLTSVDEHLQGMTWSKIAEPKQTM